MKNPGEASIQSEGDSQLIQWLECPQCKKRYAIFVWKNHSKCRQCGMELPTNPPDLRSG
jgi:Zn ribbon nucleic-acid-binding protein